MLRTRLLAAFATAVLVACSTTPSIPPATEPATTPSAPASAPPGSVSTGGPGQFAEALRAGISVDDIVSDLGRLQSIADANGGNRAAGTPGFDASAEFVAGELEAAGYTVSREPVPITAFLQTAPSRLEIEGGATFEDVRDLKAMTFSASGDVTAPIVALAFDPNAGPGDANGLGCNTTDWAGVPRGVVVIVQPGPCRRHDAVVLAQEAGVLAVVTSYAAWPRDQIRRPTLVIPADITIPVIGTTHAVGVALAEAAAAGSKVRVSTSTSVQEVQSTNLIAESPWGDPAHVVMIGGHLDSVIDGPGINDNGSGTMTVLEIARTMAELVRALPADHQPAWQLRVAFWTGEETGLFGSAAYARGLDAGTRAATEAYLNFDMVGSRNGVRVVYEEQDPPNPADEATIAALFRQALEADGLTHRSQGIGAASDHFPLQQGGIPIGGLYSGANEVKTAEDAALFGGTAGAPDDACYHLACDTVANIDPEMLGGLARAAAWVLGRLVVGEVALPG